ncbi:MAG: KGK domain-containing protein [Leptolyngbyaceae bacterium]|nr:KGK domain-containing protein [Leptolyngbyaceae bacterium]
MDKPTTMNVSQDDLIAFYHPKIDNRKPEIIKVEYITESLEELIDGIQIEELLNERLKSKEITLPVVYQYHSKGVRHASQGRQYWFKDGLKCELLNFGNQSWQKGKFRINLKVEMEFIPDKVESEDSTEDEKSHDNSSPLDEIRRSMQ